MTTPDYEKQALGQTIVESIQTTVNLRAQIFALQAEVERLTAKVAPEENHPDPETAPAKSAKNKTVS